MQFWSNAVHATLSVFESLSLFFFICSILASPKQDGVRGKRWRKRKKRRKNVTKQEKIVCTDTHRNGKIRGYSTCLRFNYFRFLLRVGYNWLFLLCLKISLMMGQQVQWPFSSVRVDSLLLTSGCMYSYSQSAACEALSQLLTKLSS